MKIEEKLIKESVNLPFIPQVIRVEDYHEFDYIQKVLRGIFDENFNVDEICLTEEEEENMSFGNYGIVYLGDEPSEEIIKDRLAHYRDCT